MRSASASSSPTKRCRCSSTRTPSHTRAITERFARWTDIDIRLRGETTRSGGHGFSALGRRELLGILQDRALSLGADVRFSSEAPPLSELGWADLIVGADGAASGVRRERYRDFIPTLEPRHCRYMWMGVELPFDAFKFFIQETPHGVFQAHAYPYDARMSTFIVETHEDTWRRAGLDTLTPGPLPPGVSDDASVEFCTSLFAEELEGRPLLANNSKWINFITVRCRRWCTDNVVLIGDAAHTAHFSIGSGTKLAMEDAVALAWAFRTHGEDIAAASCGLRGGTAADRRINPARGAGVARVVRGARPLRRAAADAVRVQPADALAPGDLRQPAAA